MATPRKAVAKKAPAKKAARKKPSAQEQPPADSMAMIRVGHHDYPMHTVSSCHTCQSPQRRWIEAEIGLARSYTSIAKRLADMPTGYYPPPSEQSLRNHMVNGHVPTGAAIRRRIVDKRAAELGQKILGEESLVDYVVVTDLIIQQGFEKLIDGDLKISTSDLLTALANKHKIEQTSEQGYDAEAYQQTLIQYMETAMKFIPPDQVEKFGAALDKNPVLRAIAAKQAGGDVVPGDLVED